MIRRALVLGLVSLACARSDGNSSGGVSKAEAAQAPKTEAVAVADKNDPMVAAADRGRIAGDSTAKVWLIVVSDFECPYCKLWHDSTYAQLRREYVETGKIRMAYINFPLAQHPHAVPAAETAMCSAVQGKFWEVHDELFKTQDHWKTIPGSPQPYFDSLAVKAGVDQAQLKQCVSSHKLAPLIRADYQRAAEAGTNSTPTFMVGGVRLSGAQPIDAMRKVLDAALAPNGAQKKS
jgi:protein-disulfide isomerase